MSTPYYAGIDLGTTNTLCAVWRPGDAQPEVLKIDQPWHGGSREGFARHELLPSAVAVLPDGDVLVGRHARELGRLSQGEVYTSIKRHMGRHWLKHYAGQTWTPERVSGCVLAAVRQQLDVSFRGDPPRQVVITVPASFGTEARRATLRAAALAGFEPRTTRLFDEPAAALFYQVQQAPPPLDGLRRLVMIDIGGGTLDVSVLELSRDGPGLVADIVGRSRFNELAGDDFDLCIAGLLLARYEAERGSLNRLRDRVRAHVYNDLLNAAEKAKVELAARAGPRPDPADFERLTAPVVVNHTPDGVSWRNRLSLGDLYHALHGFFPYAAAAEDRREDYSFFRPIEQARKSVADVTGRELGPGDVHEVYLAGGSAQLPMMAAAVQTILGADPVLVDPPMKAVALGAAWYAAFLAGEGGRAIALRERLFDGVYLQRAGGEFLELLSPRERVPPPGEQVWREVPQALQTDHEARVVELPLFLGNGPKDEDLTPLTRRRVDFEVPQPQGQPVHLAVRVDENRLVALRCTTRGRDGQTRRGRVEVSVGLGWEGEGDRPAALPGVNRRTRGPNS
jgi:molecular chaperone DnaK